MLQRSGDTVTVTIGDRPFTAYSFDPAIAKAFLQPLHAASGVVVSRSFPLKTEVPEEHLKDRGLEPHQRALYFAHGDINGSNFWAESVFSKFYPATMPSNYGHMSFRSLDEMKGNTVRASFDLVGADGKSFAIEQQSFVFSGDKHTRIIDCTIMVKALDTAVKFGDTKEGSFALRLAPELTEPQGKMTNSAGQVGEKQVWGKRADWVNVDGVIDGHDVGVVVFDNPGNLRHPTYWHARGYGLLAANPFGLSYFLNDPKQDGSYTIEPSGSLTLRYRVLIHDGFLTPAQIADRYQQYSKQ